MSLADAFLPAEVDHRNRVMQATWGHLAAKRNVKHPGHILFACGEFGDFICIRSDFKDVESSPWYYDHLHKFIAKKVGFDRSARGKVYRFDGHYRLCLNGVGQFIGKVRVIRMKAKP